MESDKASFIKQNWYLLVLSVVFLGVGIYGFVGPDKETAEANTPRLTTPAALDPRLAVVSSRTPRKRLTKEEKVLKTIESHDAKIKENPESKEAPAYLCAKGNLYRQKLGNFEEAIQCYESLLLDYPNWEGKRRVLLHLATCYNRIGNVKNEEWAYQELMKMFPAESAEYQFAKAQLGG